ncbi:MAG: acetyltransferase [Bacteroidetes bacterium]|nr:MAG: acetyltransferase [Bacteroidota bacterium]
MKLSTLKDRLQRLIADKSGSKKRIAYLRRQGMQIGERCLLNTMSFSTEPYLVRIGDHCAIANGTVFLTHDGGIRCFREDFPKDDLFARIEIGNNVFIGANCTVLPGTVVGENCIVGAGSVLRGTYPRDSVIFGNPAKVVMAMRVQKMMYKQSRNRLPTAGMSDPAKKPIVIEHFANS